MSDNLQTLTLLHDQLAVMQKTSQVLSLIAHDPMSFLPSDIAVVADAAAGLIDYMHASMMLVVTNPDVREQGITSIQNAFSG